MENWQAEQINQISNEWARAIDKYYPQFSYIWTTPEENVKFFKEMTYYFESIAMVDWTAILSKRESRVLDLGCGTGWLSAELSKHDNISTIDSVDSDVKNLEVMLPGVAKILKGNMSKINPVRGLFQPVLRSEGYYDLVVASSAVHHSDNLVFLLIELKRILDPGGKIVLLNEIPFSNFHMLRFVSVQFIKYFIRMIDKKYTAHEKQVSNMGCLYDPYLGDRMYSKAQWMKAFELAGLSCIEIKTPFCTFKDHRDHHRMSNFILSKQES